MRKEVGLDRDREDGIMYMAIEDYIKNVSATTFTVDNSGWSSASFLKLNDNSAATNPGRYSWCGADCTRHILYLTSTVKQKVYIKAHTWPERCSAKSCVTAGTTHSLFVSGQATVMTFTAGFTMVGPVEIEANTELMVITEWDFRAANTVPDWSVVAQAEQGTLSWRHDGGLVSDSLPYIERVAPAGGPIGNPPPPRERR